MHKRIDEVFCQRCRASNPLASEFCLRCGTTLMLVASSAQHRYEDLATPEPHTEHLLERISLLEYRLVRVTKIAERAVDTALRQAEISDKMCDLLVRLTEAVADMQAEERARVAEPQNVPAETTNAPVASQKTSRQPRREASNAGSSPEPRRRKRGASERS